MTKPFPYLKWPVTVFVTLNDQTFFLLFFFRFLAIIKDSPTKCIAAITAQQQQLKSAHIDTMKKLNETKKAAETLTLKRKAPAPSTTSTPKTMKVKKETKTSAQSTIGTSSNEPIIIIDDDDFFNDDRVMTQLISAENAFLQSSSGTGKDSSNVLLPQNVESRIQPAMTATETADSHDALQEQNKENQLTVSCDDILCSQCIKMEKQ